MEQNIHYSDLKGKIVLVTGSSKALGAETVRRFASAGARVVVHGRDEHERAQAEHQLIEREIEQDRTKYRRLAAGRRVAVRIAWKVSRIRLRTT